MGTNFCDSLFKKQKTSAIIENGCKRSGIGNALANGVPSDDSIRANLCTELLYTLHFLFFTHCFVCETDYRMCLSSGCLLQWEIMSVFLFESNL